MRKRKILILIILMLFAFNQGFCKFKTKVTCAYINNSGDFKDYTMMVDFVSGYELAQATMDYSYDIIAVYAILWFGYGEAAIIKIREIPVVSGEMDARKYESHKIYAKLNDPLTPYFSGYDQGGRLWYIFI